MGELVIGRPVMRQLFAVSAPLVLTSAITLTYRAVESNGEPGSHSYDDWLIQARGSLPPEIQNDLDLLFGFSGRLLYYAEELLFSFEALEPDRLDATYDEFYAHLESLPAIAFQRMAANAVRRVYRDRGVIESPPETNDPDDWMLFIRPSTVAEHVDEIAALLANPDELRRRTLRMIDGFWQGVYKSEFERELPDLQRAVRRAESLSHPVVQVAFSELTGHRLPEEISLHLGEVERVTFCPSTHLGSFVQYIFYQPELILYFNPAVVLQSATGQRRRIRNEGARLSDQDALAGLKAIADPTRLKIIGMLREREHYAQEIVGKLGISQSAVSRHLGTLESASVVTVRPAQGMKYYAVDEESLAALGDYIVRMSAHQDPA